MVAKALRLAGLYMGRESELVRPAPDNPGGFFEHAGFIRIDEDLLQATGGAWDHPPACPPMSADDPRVAQVRDRAIEVIGELAGEGSWGWKDPRASLTARFWLDLLPELRVVVCLRHPLEVALSLKQRNNTSYAHALSLWHSYYQTLLDAVPEERRIVTHYDAYFRDPEAETARVVAFAGLPASASAEAEAASEPELRHHRLDITLAEAGVDPDTIKLFEQLREEAGDPLAANEVAEQVVGSARANEVAEEVEGPARVDRSALDLLVATEQLERRDRQVASLEHERAELSDRVEQLEATGVPAAFEAVHARIDQLEDAVHEARYKFLQAAEPREDAAVLRRCRAVVRRHVPRFEEILVVSKDDPAWLDLYGRPTSSFPQDDAGLYAGFTPTHSVAAIAHLEALRLRRGSSFLLIPEVSAWWHNYFPEFIAHLEGRYEVVGDERGGLLVDIRKRHQTSTAWPRSLSEMVNRLTTLSGREPGVLDCTGRELAVHLPGRNVFVPPAGESLPYADRSVDLVLVPEQAAADESMTVEERRLRAHARRVAGVAVITIGGVKRPRVSGVEWISSEPAQAGEVPLRFVVAGPEPDPKWLAHLKETLTHESAAEVVVGPARWSDVTEDGGVVALLEEGVLPLPGCCDAARATLVKDDIGAVASKVLAADGSLEAAGTTVFADGSCAGVAAGSLQVAAPWHEFVREACGASGLLFLSAAALDRLDALEANPKTATPTGWAGRLWAAGMRVLYQPDAAAVRTNGVPGSDKGGTDVVETWGPVLPARPPRPERLDDPAWQELLAHDDVAAGWRDAASHAPSVTAR
jgi:hypothetical protein